MLRIFKCFCMFSLVILSIETFCPVLFSRLFVSLLLSFGVFLYKNIYSSMEYKKKRELINEVKAIYSLNKNVHQAAGGLK